MWKAGSPSKRMFRIQGCTGEGEMWSADVKLGCSTTPLLQLRMSGWSCTNTRSEGGRHSSGMSDGHRQSSDNCH